MSHENRLGTNAGWIGMRLVKTYGCLSWCLALSVTASIGCTFSVLYGCISEKDSIVRRKEREHLLSACCFRNFSLAPAPPGVLE